MLYLAGPGPLTPDRESRFFSWFSNFPHLEGKSSIPLCLLKGRKPLLELDAGSDGVSLHLIPRTVLLKSDGFSKPALSTCFEKSP